MSTQLRAERVAEGLYWAQVYWMNGQPTKGTERSEVNSGVPHLGWGRTYVLDRDPGSKVVTLFCPYTFEGFQVTRNSFEYQALKPTTRPYNAEWHNANFMTKWEDAVRKRYQADFDTAVVIMRILGLPIPDYIPADGQQKVSGGKAADDVLGLTKSVKRSSRKGQILAFFWPEAKSIREAMAEFGISRSNVLSQLYLLQKDHGIGYELVNEKAIIKMPSGCEDPYEPA